MLDICTSKIAERRIAIIGLICSAIVLLVGAAPPRPPAPETEPHPTDAKSPRTLGRLCKGQQFYYPLRFLAGGDRPLLVAPGERSGPSMRVWDVLARKPIGTLDCGATAGRVHCAAVAPGGAVIALGGFFRFKKKYSNRINLFDGKKLKLVGHLPEHDDSVTVLEFSPDGKLLASCAADGRIKLWDVAKRKLTRIIEVQDGKRVCALAFSPDGRRLAARVPVYRAVHVFDAATGKRVAVYNTKEGGMTTGVAFSPDGKLLACGMGPPGKLLQDYLDSGNGPVDLPSPLNIWSVRSERSLGPLKGPKDGILDVAFRPDGRWLAAASMRAVHIWDAKRLRLAHKFSFPHGVDRVVFSEDSRWMAVGALTGDSNPMSFVQMWQLFPPIARK